MLDFADVFQNNMTLQRNKPIKLFGTADTDCSATVYLNGEKIADAEISNGNFTIILPEQSETENAELKIVTSTGECITFLNIDIGEVWIAGGQSNMEFLMKYEETYEAERYNCIDEHLRFYNVPQYSFEGEKDEGFKDTAGYNKWHSARPGTLWCFSAAGYFYAKKLREELGVPVAILGCNWGGTSASAWMDIETLEADDELRVYCDDYRANENKSPDYAEKEYKNRKVSNHKLTRWVNDMLLIGNQERPDVKLCCTFVNMFRPKDIGIGWQSFQRPGGLYTTMLRKIIGYTARGVIWYQGESDDYHVEIYSKLFKTMINRWREDWNDNLPFLFVQIAPFAYGLKYPELRRQQEIVEETVDSAYMVTISDIGMEKDIHPKNKHDVGYRLALKALGKIYGKDIVCDAPYPEKAVLNGNDIVLHFANCSSLRIDGDSLNDVKIFSGMDRIQIYSCLAEECRIVLRTPDAEFKKNIRIEFAYTPYHKVNLYNEAGLPAKPFVIEVE